jgi:pimeloyl-ACP methyl ester carboxylesterase
VPVLEHRDLRIDYTDDGAGEAVVLVHSSASGNRMWKKLVETLKPSYRVMAINLFGYGETRPWAGSATQTLADQVRLVAALVDSVPGSLRLVGHSFGGSVVMKAAAQLGPRVSHLVLLEPNPFYLLAQHGRTEAYAEAVALRDHIKTYGAAGDWSRVAERFADYFQGAGSWSTMEQKRRDAFALAIQPNFHEWDAVMNETTALSEWAKLRCRTLVLRSKVTNRTIVEICELLSTAAPHWTHQTIDAEGHMAPLTRPDVVNPLVANFLGQ